MVMEQPENHSAAVGEETKPYWRRAASVTLQLLRLGAGGVIRTTNIARKRGRHFGRRLRRAANLRRPFIRMWRRSKRHGTQLAARRVEWRVEREIDRLVRGDQPIILGPWISEVGFEILYWVPFLQWFRNHYDLDPRRLIAVSRGGVASWYDGIAATYVEIFDLVDPETFATKNEARRYHQDDASRKQLERSDFDNEILTGVREKLGLVGARVCHPSLMYRLFRQFWLGQQSLAHVQTFTRFVPKRAMALVETRELPDEYVAVKFYAAASLPENPCTGRILHSLVVRLCERVPVVVLDTGLAVDDHGDYLFGPNSRIVHVRHLMEPRNNLGVQTQIIAGAKAFLGTCGSVAWLAPMLGVETVGVLSDERFLHPHLYMARQAYRTLRAGRFMTLDLAALDSLGLTLTRSAAPVLAGNPARRDAS